MFRVVDLQVQAWYHLAPTFCWYAALTLEFRVYAIRTGWTRRLVFKTLSALLRTCK